MRYKINFSNYNRTEELRKKLVKNAFLTVSILLICLSVYGVMKFFSINKEIEKVEKEYLELRMKLEKAKEERKRILTEQEEIVLRNKIKFYNDLKTNKLYQTVFFNILEERTPDNIKLINVDIDLSRKTFIINGETLSPESIVFYLGELQKVGFFKNVTIIKQVMQRSSDRKIVIGNFEIRGEII